MYAKALLQGAQHQLTGMQVVLRPLRCPACSSRAQQRALCVLHPHRPAWPANVRRASVVTRASFFNKLFGGQTHAKEGPQLVPIVRDADGSIDGSSAELFGPLVCCFCSRTATKTLKLLSGCLVDSLKVFARCVFARRRCCLSASCSLRWTLSEQ